MANFSFLQFIVIILLFILIFGDIPKIKDNIKKTLKKSRKKGN